MRPVEILVRDGEGVEQFTFDPQDVDVKKLAKLRKQIENGEDLVLNAGGAMFVRARVCEWIDDKPVYEFRPEVPN